MFRLSQNWALRSHNRPSRARYTGTRLFRSLYFIIPPRCSLVVGESPCDSRANSAVASVAPALAFDAVPRCFISVRRETRLCRSLRTRTAKYTSSSGGKRRTQPKISASTSSLTLSRLTTPSWIPPSTIFALLETPNSARGRTAAEVPKCFCAASRNSRCRSSRFIAYLVFVNGVLKSLHHLGSKRPRKHWWNGVPNLLEGWVHSATEAEPVRK